jgi:hypothetical protein
MLFAIESGMEGATSKTDILRHRIAKLAVMVAEASQESDESLEESLASKYYTPDRKLIPDWQVFNAVNGALLKVGAITGNTFVSNSAQIVYPGGVTAKPVDLPMTI